MSKTRRALLALVLLAALCRVPVPQARAASLDNPQRFEMDGFFYEAPTAWTVSEKWMDGHYVRTHADSHDVTATLYVRVDSVRDLGYSDASEQRVLSEMVDRLKNGPGFIRLEQKASLEVAGCHAIRCAGIVDTGYKYRVSSLFVIHQGMILSLAYTDTDALAREQDAFFETLIATVAVEGGPVSAGAAPSDWRQLYEPADYDACASPGSANGLRGAKIRVEGRLTAVNEGNGMREWIVRQADGKEWSVIMHSDVGADIVVRSDVACYGIYLGLSAKPTVNLLRCDVMYYMLSGGNEVASIYESMSFEEIHRYLTQ